MKLVGAIRRPLSKYRQNIRKVFRARKLKKTKPNISRQRLERDLYQLGIRQGDTLFIHSSLKSIGYVDGGANTVIDALIDVVSPGGNVIIPTYYMPGGTILSVCRQADTYLFDPINHGTVLGRIPSVFLERNDIKRSIHPTHSVSAWGPDAEMIVKDHHTAGSTYGLNTPWGRLVELNGKLLGIGISIAPITFYHYLEDIIKDDFPEPIWLDPVELHCYDYDHNIVSVSVKPYDPNVTKRRLEKPDREDLRSFLYNDFRKNEIIVEGMIGVASSWYMDASALYRRLNNLMNEGITIYSTNEQLKEKLI